MNDLNVERVDPFRLVQRWLRLAVVAVVVCLPLVACGGSGSDGPSGNDDDQTVTTTPDDRGGGGTSDDDGGGGLTEGEEPLRSDDVDLRARLTGLKYAIEADRVEVDGKTVHIYFSDGAHLMTETSWCDMANVNIPEGYSAVTHWEGKETAC